jgi:hypothetical protein
MEAKSSLAGAILGFVLGCIALRVLYMLVELSEVQRIRVPLALAVLPFVWAWVGLKFGNEILIGVRTFAAGAQPLTRLLIAIPILWALVVACYVATFEPFGSSLHAYEWIFLVKIVVFPAILLWVGYVIIKYFVVNGL